MNFFPIKFLLSCLVFFTFTTITFSQNVQRVVGADQSHAYLLGKTKPLRELAPVSATPVGKREALKASRPSYAPRNFLGYNGPERVNPLAKPFGPDPVIQRTLTGGRVVVPAFVAEGITEAEADGVQVPDVNGDKGKDQYIQIVNASWMQVFANDGSELSAPFNANVIWNEIGEASFSDPVIQYDEVADRWLVTDLAGITEVLYAVSVTNDPLGSYYAYKFVSSGIVDYPKYGIAPGAYFFTVNEGGNFHPVFAMNRQALLAGDTLVDVQRIEIPAIDGSFPTLSPVDWNGDSAPPTDDIQVVRVNDDAWGNGNATDVIELWNVSIDWGEPGNTLSTLIQIEAEPFDADVCDGGQTCIGQQGSSQELDAIATIVMNRPVYRNFGSHESIVLNFTVNPGNDIAGIRWMELRKSGAADWSVYQEGTLAPDDGINRWLGSMAINRKGAIGLAYAVSGDTIFPSLRFTGRLPGDPLGTMTIDEYQFATGLAPRTLSNRYGDYFSMSVDPMTDAFWFTGEYVLADNSWGTKVMSFATQKDTNDLTVSALLSPTDDSALTDMEAVRIRVTNTGLNPQTNFKVAYQFESGSPMIEDALLTTLEPDSSYVHVFTTREDLSNNGQYNFTVFVQPSIDDNPFNDTLRRVVQNLPNLDLNLLGFQNEAEFTCESQYVAQVICQNFGTDLLDSFTLGWQLNDGATQNITWTGSLPYRERTVVDILVDDLVEGNNTITVFPIVLNDGLDEINTNDTLVGSVLAILAGTTVTLDLLTDGYPEETSWELISNGVVIYSGDRYGGREFENIEEIWCLQEDSCYTFRIMDSFGDGLRDYYGDGDYQIRDSEGNLLASLMNVSFGYEEQNDFCLTTCALEVNVVITHESASGASDGVILIEVTSGSGPFQYSIDGGLTFQNDPLFQGLTPEDYQVVVSAADGCEHMELARVESFVATGDISKPYDITVSPNPSTDGIVRLHVTGLSDVYKPLNISVINNQGNKISHQPLPRLNGAHQGIISLRNFAPGTYYLIINLDGKRELVKVVRL